MPRWQLCEEVAGTSEALQWFGCAVPQAAVLTCMSYVDLNPVRAGLAETPEASDFTSIQQRIYERSEPDDEPQAPECAPQRPRLMALQPKTGDAHANALSFCTQDYLDLVDWSGRRSGKTGVVPSPEPLHRSLSA